jgi:hypothetical protein
MRSQPAVKDLGDPGVIHDRQRLTLLIEARHHGLGIHPRLHKFEGDALHEGMASLGKPHGSEAAIT